MLETKVTKRTAIIIIALTILIASVTGVVAKEIINHNAYDLDSRLEEKLPEILESISKDPDNVEARIELGLVYLQREEWEKAIEHLLVAKKNTKNPDLLYEIGRAYGHLGDLTEAEKYFIEVVKLNPEHDLALFALEQLAQNRGEITDSNHK